MSHKINLSIEQILEFIILGINNGNYEAAKGIAQDTLDHLKKEAKSTDQPNPE